MPFWNIYTTELDPLA